MVTKEGCRNMAVGMSEIVCDSVHNDYFGGCPMLQRFLAKIADHLTGTTDSTVIRC